MSAQPWKRDLCGLKERTVRIGPLSPALVRISGGAKKSQSFVRLAKPATLEEITASPPLCGGEGEKCGGLPVLNRHRAKISRCHRQNVRANSRWAATKIYLGVGQA